MNVCIFIKLTHQLKYFYFKIIKNHIEIWIVKLKLFLCIVHDENVPKHTLYILYNCWHNLYPNVMKTLQ